MKKILFKFAPTLLFVPGIALAQTLDLTFRTFVHIINGLMPIIVALAVLFFMWGAFLFVKSSGNEEERSEGRARMIYGVIGIFVMVSVWGLVKLLANTLALESGYLPPFPTFPTIG